MQLTRFGHHLALVVEEGQLIRFGHHHNLGGGPAVVETLTIDVDNWGGFTSFPHKTVTTIVANCGGVTLYLCKTVTMWVLSLYTCVKQLLCYHCG